MVCGLSAGGNWIRTLSPPPVGCRFETVACPKKASSTMSSRGGSSPPEPKVRRLTAGGSEIRTFGPPGLAQLSRLMHAKRCDEIVRANSGAAGCGATIRVRGRIPIHIVALQVLTKRPFRTTQEWRALHSATSSSEAVSVGRSIQHLVPTTSMRAPSTSLWSRRLRSHNRAQLFDRL